MNAKRLLLAVLLITGPALACARASEAGFSVKLLRHGQLVELSRPQHRHPNRSDEVMIREVVSDVRRDIVRIRTEAAGPGDGEVWVLRGVRVIRDDRADLRDAAERVRLRMRELKKRLEAEGWR
jgi:hypothetical protein